MKVPFVAVVLILTLAGFQGSSTYTFAAAYASRSEKTYTLSAGERPFSVTYTISNAALSEIYLNKTDFLLHTHFQYSIVAVVANVSKSGGTLTITLPADLMASRCNYLPSNGGEYPVLINTPRGVDGLDYNAYVTSVTDTNITISVNFPSATTSIDIPQYGELPEIGCATDAYKLIHNDKEYWIDYISFPPILNIKLDNNNPALLVTLTFGPCFNNLGGCYTDIQIPRDVLDAKAGQQQQQKDVPFIVTVDGNITQAHEIETTNTTRTIHIPLTDTSPAEHVSIVITGTTAVPEFSSSTSGWIMVIAVSGIVVLGIVTKRRFNH